MSQLFFAPNLPDSLILPEDESHHLTKVLRFQIGETFRATDGKGYFYSLRIKDARKNRVTVSIIYREFDSQSKSGIHLAVAPTKNIDRYEWMVEKCVEMGAERITPILCEHSERKRVRIDRLEKIAISAMKQSLHSIKPIIDELIPLSDFMDGAQDKQLLFAHCEEGRKEHISKELSGSNKILLIGPEGDFSPTEIEWAKEKKARMIDLGHYRLRTETAAMHACSLLNHFGTR